MKRVLTASVLIVAVVALIFWGNTDALIVFSGLVACLAAFEYDALAKAYGAPVPLWWLLPAMAVFFVVTDWRPLEAPLPLLSALGLSLFAIATFRGPMQQALPVAASGFFALLYIAYPLSLLPLMGARPDGPTLLLFLMLVVWTGDIAALYTGRAIGKHKLAPSISPNKTWEGAVASVLGSVLVAWALIGVSYLVGRNGYTFVHVEASTRDVLIMAAIVNIAAQVGDLMESAIKRGVSVKDSGSILPGHGGMLDRIDALLVAAPVLWYLMMLRDALNLGPF